MCPIKPKHEAEVSFWKNRFMRFWEIFGMIYFLYTMIIVFIKEYKFRSTYFTKNINEIFEIHSYEVIFLFWLIIWAKKDNSCSTTSDFGGPSCQSISIMNCESYYILHTLGSLLVSGLQLLRLISPHLKLRLSSEHDHIKECELNV